jgi:disulfide bond formation protein DsbB
MRLTPRLLFIAIFLACAALIATALYMQEEMGLEPCPMCIIQRYAFVAIGVVALVAAIHDPARLGLKLYALLTLLFVAAGGGTAIRQSWLQHHPPKSQSCGTDLEFLVNNFPLSQALPKIFAGSGDCAEIHWTFLGLTIPEWALVWFVLMAIAALYAAFMRRVK